MSQTIDNQIVKIQFDNAGFEKGAQESISTLDRLKKALHFNDVNMTPLQKAFAETEATATKAGFSIRDIWLKVANTLEDQVANKIVDMGKKVFNALSFEGLTDGFREYELKMGSVQTIMAGTGESLATVNRYLEELNTYSDQTIYSFSDMTQNIGKFTNAGVKLKDAVAAIKGIANEAAVSGANANEASRAMYNFSQALSAGYVKLIDWKSIENANMATKEFKQTLIDVAQGIGTVKKVGNDWQTTTTNLQGKISDMFNATKNFNDSLNHQWMTTEVLTGALEIYATDIRKLSKDELTDYENKLRDVYHLNEDQIIQYEQLGIKAADSATEIKTFTMLMDTLKEAIGSGWAMTWQYFIGDFEQAKALFTSVGNTLGGMIDSMSAARNAFVKSGLQTGWEKFTTMQGLAIPESEKFRDILLKTARAHNVLTKEQVVNITSTEDLMKSFHELGWVTGDLLTESVGDYVKTLESMSDSELEAAGITQESLRQLKNLNGLLQQDAALGGKWAQQLAQGMIDLGGRENIIAGLKNVFHSLVDTLTPVGEAFNKVFGVMDPTNLFNLTKRFREFTEQMKVSSDAANTIRTSFTLAFGGIKTIIDAVLTGFNGVFKLVLPVFNLFDAIFGLIGKVVAALTGSKGALDAANKFTKVGDKIGSKYLSVMQKLANFINKVAEAIRGIPDATVFVKIHDAVEGATKAVERFWNAFVSMPVIQQMIQDFNNTIASIDRKLTPVINSIKKAFGDVKKEADKFFSFETLNKNLTFVYDKVKQFITLVKGFATRMKTFFTNLKEGKNVVESFRESFGDIIDKLKELKQNILDFFDNLFSKGDEMEGKFNLEKIQQAIHDFVTNITPDQVTMIAVAGTFMLIALNLLKLSEALKNAADAFTGVGTAVKKVIDSYVKKQKSTIVQVAESIVIVAAALWVLAQVPKDDLNNAVKAMIAITACLGALTLALAGCGAILKESGGTKGMIELAAGLAAVAGSFMIVTLSLKLLEGINIKGIIGKVLAIGVILTGLIGLTYLMKKLDKFNKGSLTVLAVSGALLLTAEALARLASIPTSKVSQAIETMFKIMVGLAAVTFAAGKVGIFSAIGLIAVVMSLSKIMPAIEGLVNYDYVKIKKGLEKNKEVLEQLGIMLGVMTIIGAFAGNRIKGAGIALLSLAATFAIMLGISKLVGMMRPDELAKGILFLWNMTAMISVMELCSKKSKLAMFDGQGAKIFTKLAVTMGILLGVAKLASMMEWKDLAKGELALLGLVGITAAMIKTAKMSKEAEGVIQSVSKMLIAISLVLGMVVTLSFIPYKKMLPAFAAVMSIIGGIAALAHSMSGMASKITVFDKKTQKVASAMGAFIVATAMIAACGVIMAVLARQEPKNVMAAAASLTGVIVAVSALANVISKVKPGFNGNQIGTVMFSLFAVAAVAGVIGALSKYIKQYNIDTNVMISSAEAIAMVLVGLTPAMYAISKFNSTDAKLGTAVGSVITVLGVLAGVAGAIWALSKYGGDTSAMIAAAQSLAIALLAISVPIAVLAAVGEFMPHADFASMATTVLQAILVLGAVTTAIGVLSKLGGSPDAMVKSAIALATVLVAISVPIAVLGIVGELCRTANPVVMLAAVGGAVGALLGITAILSDFANRIDVEAAEKINAALPSLMGVMLGVGALAVALSAAGVIAQMGGGPMAVVSGFLAFTAAILALAEVVTAIAILGDVIRKTNLGTDLEIGLSTLVVIAQKIGEAIGAFIDGFAEASTRSLGKIADRLTEFSEKMIPFTDNMSKVNQKALEGCKNLAGAMLYLTAAEFLDGLSRWMRIFGVGRSNLDFKTLGVAVAEFAEAVKDIPENAISKAAICAMIAKKLASIENGLDAKGGWAKAIFGEKDLEGFAEGIKKFGEAIFNFCDAVKDLPENAPQLAQNAAAATDPIIKLTGSLVAEKGLLQDIIGHQDLGEFGSHLKDFATGLTEFVATLATLESATPNYKDLIQNCADATGPMVELANGLEPFGQSLKTLIKGDHSLDKFGDTLNPFAEGLKEFVEKISYIASHEPNYNQLIIDCAASSTSLVTLANSIERIGGVFSGENNLQMFGQELQSYGHSLDVFIEYVADIDWSIIDKATANTANLINLAKRAITVKATSFDGLQEAIHKLSQLPLVTIANDWATAKGDLVSDIDAVLKALAKVVSDRKKADEPIYEGYGKNIGISIARGIRSSADEVKRAVSSLASAVKSSASSSFSSDMMTSYGANISKGLAKGIGENSDDAIHAAQAVASAVSQTIKGAMKIKSPSRVTYEYGKYIDEGLANGIYDHTYMAVKSVSYLTDDIVSTANNMISAITATLDSNMDMQPTIRPVLDTSDIETKAKRIGSMFNASDLALAYNISGSVRRSVEQKATNSLNSTDAVKSTDVPTQISFTQNNYSPKALSRIDIYRDTKNEISMLKGALSNA